MILWYKNYKIDDQIISNITHNFSFQQPDEFDGYYTSFFTHPLERPEKILDTFYDSIIENVMDDLNLHERSRYSYTYWCQLYPPNIAGHGYHDHFSGQEILSFVHFIKSQSKSFNFIMSDGEKIYPQNQSDGDLIVFPAWALHSADINTSDKNRIVIAGNIMLDYIEVVSEDGSSVQTSSYRNDETTTVWKSIVTPPTE